jgi:hypothetical protein
MAQKINLPKILFLFCVVLNRDRLCGLVVEFFATDPEAQVRFPELQKKSSVSGTGSTQPREYN